MTLGWAWPSVLKSSSEKKSLLYVRIKCRNKFNTKCFLEDIMTLWEQKLILSSYDCKAAKRNTRNLEVLV